jgi:hypothetical protein
MSERWLIWSNEHRAWWRPAGHGYTTATHQAGMFSRDEAEAIVRDANRVPRDPPNEVMVLAPFLHQLDVDYPT